MIKAFEITREDGRSNAQVVLDLMGDAEPGRTFTFAQIADALSAGTDRKYTRADVRQIAASAYDRMLAEHQRALHNVRGIGYRVAPAADHNRLAIARKRRADVQLERGVSTLQNVRWNELDPEARKAHEGTLMVMSALHQQQRAMEKRQEGIERVIARLMGKGRAG
jgi:hypothetical protein